ncbi:hypothetical protein CMI47_10345 [Candidatus Pacearchaeota archaeon]|nr:hypothetical protein [Candidatus Pacearchaeota archaeon]|tara:strand:+ start:1456 stop:2697 length:1242 start_codon:yes stop_codon:yes gene_type:complete
MSKEFFEYGSFSNATAALDLYTNAIKTSLGRKYNVYGKNNKQTIFPARLLTDPLTIEDAVASGFFNSTTLKKIAAFFPSKTNLFIFKGRIEGPNSPHIFLPDPCSLPYAEDQEKTAQLISMHTTFVSTAGSVGDSIKLGDVANVRLNKSAFSYNLEYGEFVGSVNKSTGAQNNEKVQACQQLSDLFSKFQFSALGFSFLSDLLNVDGASLLSVKDYSGMSNVIIEYYEKINTHPSFNNSRLIGGPPSAGVPGIVSQEVGAWEGLRGTQGATMLRKYEQLLGNPTNYYPGQPWSAAFISYVMNTAGTSFPTAASHYKYTSPQFTNRMNGATSGWVTFSVQEKVQIGVGDVLVKPRSGDYYWSHGDVVFRIQGNVAYLAGGNLGNTAKIAGSIPLNADRTLASPGPYLIVNKFLG